VPSCTNIAKSANDFKSGRLPGQKALHNKINGLGQKDGEKNREHEENQENICAAAQKVHKSIPERRP
jgi:hypothetical protein